MNYIVAHLLCRTLGLTGAGPGVNKCKQDAPSRVRSGPLVRHRKIYLLFLFHNNNAPLKAPVASGGNPMTSHGWT